MKQWVIDRVGPQALKMMEVYKDGEQSTVSTKQYAPICWLLPRKTMKEFRPMLRTSFNAQMISGRRRLRSSAALRAWQMKTINEYEVLLSSLADQPLAELRAMARKSITSLASVQPTPRLLGTLW